MRIPLTRGQVALIDADDLERVSAAKWFAVRPSGRGWYAATYSFGKRMVYLHRFLLNEPTGQVDHRNRDGLDCRKENLRPCAQWQNSHNAPTRKSAGYRGVLFDKGIGRWRAEITVRRTRINIGCFATAREAALAYDAAALGLVGEFATLNFPLENVEPMTVDQIAAARSIRNAESRLIGSEKNRQRWMKMTPEKRSELMAPTIAAAAAARSGVCKNGHPLVEGNIARNKKADGSYSRKCRQCYQESRKKARERRRALTGHPDRSLNYPYRRQGGAA